MTDDPPVVQQIEAQIADERAALDAWLDDSYKGREDKQYYGENDISYPGWAGIEALTGCVFDDRLIRHLSDAAVESLLFFISRSDEGGSIIAWLNTDLGSPFSHVGDLSYEDLLRLSEAALARPDDYCDYQLVAVYRKCESLDEQATTIVRGFFGKQAEYTRRMVLHTLQHFDDPHAIDLAMQLWEDSQVVHYPPRPK